MNLKALSILSILSFQSHAMMTLPEFIEGAQHPNARSHACYSYRVPMTFSEYLQMAVSDRLITPDVARQAKSNYYFPVIDMYEYKAVGVCRVNLRTFTSLD
ncbi:MULTISPECIES: hypothetical protein [Pseudoalteromonas]|uniref:Uncharacterized protein n=2 Tax=Pseudoalteromonas TaxID=53246 RepID=V4HR00_PSEL2|nr:MULTISPECIES: hypothetical protein [Pseudoalteromonas]ESP92223.1 hypothetical protein PL2TA16_05060 [Pseudoalteromonas luteoviolacea 2ta16]KZN29331.1 hypothetical protein N483_07805 [Pseudoalteromonas luteoviolacea NCIMB 1944]MBQ4835628.1 hypothetical protein [Pseudoalteromonas luteoviolacea]MCG7549339.1 hypothetical protein [Pseudoalteromonas sp. Of7M-16]MDK2594120.1 hypothetical protein [Pseudoalteromonas sp. P94(2023)]